jgi:hypothetical protein
MSNTDLQADLDELTVGGSPFEKRPRRLLCYIHSPRGPPFTKLEFPSNSGKAPRLPLSGRSFD